MRPGSSAIAAIRLLCVWWLLVCLGGWQAEAQTFRFRVYGVDDGLANQAVTTMAQDGAGYLWVGSLNGLFRYNGDHFERFGHADGLGGNRVISLAVSPGGELWAGTEAGVAVWRSEHFDPVRFDSPPLLSGSSALGIEPDTGDLWIATKTGVFRVAHSGQTGGGLHALPVASFPGKVYNGITFGKDGSVWAASSRTVYRWKGGKLTDGESLGASQEDWEGILVDRRGKVWLRSISHLLSLGEGDSRFSKEDTGLPSAEVIALGLDDKGEILVPTIFGLARRSGKGWAITGRRNGLPMDSVSCVLFDREGSPWVGLNGGGVARWLGFQAWSAWTAPEWMKNDAVWTIAEDAKSTIWLGTDKGVSRMLAGQDGLKNPQAIFPIRASVHAIAPASQDEIWVGTNHQGLYRCNAVSSTCLSYGHAVGIFAQKIDRLLIDKEDVLWVSTNVGVYSTPLKQRPLRFTKASLPGIPSAETSSRISLDPRGSIVIASGGSLWFERHGLWTRTQPGRLLRDQQIDEVHADAAGMVWVSYVDNFGVTAISGSDTDHPKARLYDQSNGIRSNFVYALASDRRGRMFVGTDSGIDVLEKETWRHYGMADGLVWTDLNTSALFTDSRGWLWIGTSHGLARFQPESEQRSTLPPTPLISRVELGGRSQSLQNAVAIPYQNRDVSIRFSALSFMREADMRFQYRLSGLADQWTSSEDRDVRLLNLPPGSYTLEMSAKGGDGVSSSKPAQLQLVVATPWWRTKVFFILVVCTLMALGRAIWVRRVRGLLLRQKELEEAVQERTQALVIEKQHLVEAREALREQAMRDPLTALLNRRAVFEFFSKTTQEAIQENRSLAVVMADVDYFKFINDEYGHLAGDAVLVEISSRLSSAIRFDDVVGRYGGEEFILILPDCTGDEARLRAESLRLAIETEPFLIGSASLQITCSFGVSAATGPALARIELIAEADAALYEAKRGGRNQVLGWDAPSVQDAGLRRDQMPVCSSE